MAPCEQARLLLELADCAQRADDREMSVLHVQLAINALGAASCSRAFSPMFLSTCRYIDRFLADREQARLLLELADCAQRAGEREVSVLYVQLAINALDAAFCRRAFAPTFLSLGALRIAASAVANRNVCI